MGDTSLENVTCFAGACCANAAAGRARNAPIARALPRWSFEPDIIGSFSFFLALPNGRYGTRTSGQTALNGDSSISGPLRIRHPDYRRFPSTNEGYPPSAADYFVTSL